MLQILIVIQLNKMTKLNNLRFIIIIIAKLQTNLAILFAFNDANDCIYRIAFNSLFLAISKQY